MRVAVLPALLVLMLTLIISFLTGHPEDFFLTRSVWVIPVRFVIVTLMLLAPVLFLPRLLAIVGNIARNQGFFGQLVKTSMSTNEGLSKLVAWVLRPLQGVALSMIFAERFLNLLEFSVGASNAQHLARLTLFMVASVLVSLFLSTIWALDDLGVKFYYDRTSEVRTAGSSVGTVLPLITGAVGVSSLFHLNSPVDALIGLVGIVMVLYPPYLLFAVSYHEFVRRRSAVLSKRLPIKRMEMNVG